MPPRQASPNTTVLAKPPESQGVVGPPPPAIAPRDVTTEELQRQYVAGGGQQWYGQFARALPFPLDDLSRQFGDDIYFQMLHDPMVSASVDVLKASILEDGLTLAPAVTDKADPDYDRAVAFRDEAEAMLDDLEISLDDVLRNALDCLVYGNRVGEQVYTYAAPDTTSASLPRGKILRLSAIKIRPRRAIAYVVDGYMTLVGLLVQELNQPSPILTGWVVDPQNPPANLISPQHAFVVTFRPDNNDPRGSSILRPAYTPWWLKQQIYPEFRKYLAQFAGSSVWATTSEGAQSLQVSNPDGSVSWLTPEQILNAALAQFRNGTAAAFPFGTELHVISSQGEGEAFLRGLEFADGQITMAILLQRLATQEGAKGNGARAAAETHQDVLDTLVRQAKKSLVRAITKQILRPWMVWNWGDNAKHLAPKASLGSTERADLPDMMRSVAALSTAHYLHSSQLSTTDEMLGLPVRDLTEDETPEEQDNEPAQPDADSGATAAGRDPSAGVSPPSQLPAEDRRVDVRAHSRAVKPRPAEFAEGLLPAGADEPLGPVPDPSLNTKDRRSAARRLFDDAFPALAGLLLAGGTKARWTYDADKRRYRDGRTGRLVSPMRLIEARDRVSDTSALQIKPLTDGLADGSVALQAWEGGMQDAIQTAYLAQWAAGRGGFRAITEADWLQLAVLVRGQFGFLRGFTEAVATGSLSKAAILARAALYLASSVQAFERAQAATYGIELPAYPGDGSSECKVNDRCAWRLDPRDDGTIAATWVTEKDRAVCPTCAERGEAWNPLLAPIPVAFSAYRRAV